MITKNHIIEAINNCKAGNLEFNNGENLYCFLFENTWLPLSAIVNKAARLSDDNNHYTKDNALVIMLELFDYVKVKQVAVQNNILVHLTTEEKLDEINCLAKMIAKLSN